jgi:hypothetical protein
MFTERPFLFRKLYVIIRLLLSIIIDYRLPFTPIYGDVLNLEVFIGLHIKPHGK